MGDDFDYVIVGAGTAGCVLANRLSADGRSTVLLLEAGPRSRSVWTRIPVGYFRTVFDPRLSWGYETRSQDELDGRRLPVPRGRLLGGTGAINGLVYVRGQPQDYDAWAAAGNPGWSYDDVLPYFRRSEAQQPTNAPLGEKAHGRDGPMAVSDYPDRHRLCEAFVAAAVEAGLPANPDFNDGDQFGAGYYQISTRNGLRSDTAAAFLRPSLQRKALTVRCNATVIKVEVADGQARAVRYCLHGQVHRAQARREIVIAAGAINAPQILQHSGIGDPAHLRAVGVQVVHDLPGVGANLRDHLQAQAVYRCRLPVSLNDDLKSPWRKAGLAARYLLRRQGPMAGGPAPAGAFGKSDDSRPRPDLQIHFMPLSMSRPGVVDDYSGFSFNVSQSRPQSAGSVRIASADPFEAPAIEPAFLSAEIDRQVLVAGLRLARRIARSPAFDPYRGDEVRPGPTARGDGDLLDYARSHATSIYHPVGTCRMGPGPDAVVDARLRVHGIRGLRVADASIMPMIPSGNTNAPTVMVAEKASDLMLADRDGETIRKPPA